MNPMCDEVRPQLYELALGRLDEAARPGVQAHVENCVDCRKELEQARLALGLLDRWEPPQASASFGRELRAAILAAEPQDAPGVWQMLTAAFRGGWRPLVPVVGIAALLLAVVVVRWSSLPEPGGEPGVRDLPLAVGVTPAPSPLQVVVEDPQLALEALSRSVSAHGGRVVRRQPVPTGLAVTVAVPPSSEASVLGEIKRLGRATAWESGFKDGDGHIVVILSRARPASER